MKDYKDTKLLSEDCMVNRSFCGVTGGNKVLQKSLSNITITHSIHGKIKLDREEAINLKLFLENSLEQEF
ncbi:hypothetical protein J41TS2_24990 [Bacillus sonorensis]|uniref:hypothetical protein n=1 Tax=Bacillus sonorensis TaxID=119858 RepID=UPI001B068514|nr:hypothetical protein [Bacillus sonorensis]GIN67078.1 hypothetical protein J41TS2_24990 [Bacillus sonorensis]